MADIAGSSFYLNEPITAWIAMTFQKEPRASWSTGVLGWAMLAVFGPKPSWPKSHCGHGLWKCPSASTVYLSLDWRLWSRGCPDARLWGSERLCSKWLLGEETLLQAELPGKGSLIWPAPCIVVQRAPGVTAFSALQFSWVISHVRMISLVMW